MIGWSYNGSKQPDSFLIGKISTWSTKLKNSYCILTLSWKWNNSYCNFRLFTFYLEKLSVSVKKKKVKTMCFGCCNIEIELVYYWKKKIKIDELDYFLL